MCRAALCNGLSAATNCSEWCFTLPAMSSLSGRVLELRFRAFAERQRASLLLIPLLMLLGTVLIYVFTSWLDNRYDTGSWPLVLRLSSGAAVSLLGTIAGATITTAGVVFSLLVVSLQLASGQFSPRVLRGFYRDRFGQAVIGLLTASFTYCVVALSRVDSDDKHAPALTIEVAMALGLSSIIAIVAYLDRISRRQYVGSIAQRIGEETLELVQTLTHEPASEPSPPEFTGLPAIVAAPRDGWVQQLSHDIVIDSVPSGSVVRLETRVGAYVVKGAPLATIWPAPDRINAVSDAVDDAVIIGDIRTMQQDIDFGLRQLTDIALRALSPAVNDPTTAIEVMMRIGSIMRRLMTAQLPPQVRAFPGDKVLLTPWELDHDEYVAHAFDQLRQAAAPQTAVALALVRTLRMLIEVCESDFPNRVPALERQVELTIAGCENAGLLAADAQTIRAAAYRPQLAR